MRARMPSADLLSWPALWPAGSGRHDMADGTASRTMDLQTADDHTLVTAFLDGHSGAFDVIFERHRRQLYQICYRFAGSHEDAADLLQESFIRAFKGLRSFKGDASLSTWLYRIAVNTCLNRAAVKRPATDPIDAVEPPAAKGRDPLDEVMRRERSETVRDAIAKLPPKQRATIVLRVYQDLPHEEIARVLQCTVGAAKANVFHALGNLRRMLKS